ncbi:MAG: efflux RND transporter periplasmic adaptor subunit [Aliarcobacter sp.]|nr:efflux RND transporter periplasmic adaptor subunit [Aliarcobacter sp.]
MRKSIFTIAFIFLGLNTLNAQDKPQAPALPVEAFKIENKISTTTKTYPAIIKSFEEVEVRARVKGILVEKYFNEGDTVKKGTLLYKIEQDTYLANLNVAKANLKTAQANYKKAQKDYERAKSLINTKSISVQQYDEYTYGFENALSLVESAKASLQQAQIQFDYTKVYAPIDGIVGIKKTDLGNLVGSNDSDSLLVTITNTNPVYAEFSLSKDDASRYLSQIREKSAKVKLQASNKTYEDGIVDFISPKIDSNTDTLFLRAKFKNENNEILIGEFAKIEISNLDLGKVFVIPENAILKTAQGTFVYVIEDSTAKLKPVTTGILVKEGITIKSGLNENDQIVISNMAKLKPDTKIQILNKEK